MWWLIPATFMLTFGACSADSDDDSSSSSTTSSSTVAPTDDNNSQAENGNGNSGNNGNTNSNSNNNANETTVETETKGVEQADGSFLVLDWDAAKYQFTESTESAAVSGTYDDVAVLSGKSKKDAGYIQLSKNGSASAGLKFYVPLNTSKIVVTAKVGSSSATTAKAVIETNTEDWKESFTVSYQKEDSTGTLKNAAKDYDFVPNFTVKTDDEGNALTQKTIILYNSDTENSLNITAIKVYAPTAWEKTVVTISAKDTNTGDKYNSEDTSSSVKFENTEATMTNSAVQIIESEGWLESAYIKFTPYTGAKSYTVKVDGVAIDEALIRTYPDYVRADAIGLTAGEHKMSVCANLESGSTAESSATMNVLAHERTGFAFTSDTLPGAYNADGTLKANAIVIYVTNDNFNSVKLTVKKNAKGETIDLLGVQAIVDTSGYWKYASFNNDAPLVIRIIGKIDTAGFPSGSWGSSAEGLQVKGTGKINTMVTIEGVGDDATLHGFGILCRSTKYVELRNFAVMCCKDDSISLDTDNLYTWVHNLDLFYGNAGGDADQAKGDGTLDVKGDSKYQTYSYNHFWDSGKSSLCGMKSESGPNYITYHHNWFDHSDSRHPRVRSMSVHVFNNYFDGNAKYGIGAATGSSIFAEGNFFRNAHDPMMSSKQGTDATGDGTFSGEDGGIIKAYNNKFTECNTNGVKFQFVTSKDVDDNDFDCYVVDNRSDEVPSSVKTVAGGTTYDNFDTLQNIGVTAAQVDDPDTAKAKVVKYSGRHNPDFTWTFDNTKDDASYAVNSGLKSAITAYTSKLVSVQNLGTVSNSTSGDTGNTGDNTSGNTGDNGGSGNQGTTVTPATITYPTASLVAGTYTDKFDTIGFSLIKTGNSSIAAKQINIFCGDYLAFHLDGKYKITATVGNKGCMVVKSDGSVQKDMGSSAGSLDVTLEAGDYYITTGTGVASGKDTRLKPTISITAQ